MQRFPENFSDIGNCTFEQVFKSHKEFVDFTLTEMEKPTKLFKRWQDFCKSKMNVKINEHVSANSIEQKEDV